MQRIGAFGGADEASADGDSAGNARRGRRDVFDDVAVVVEGGAVLEVDALAIGGAKEGVVGSGVVAVADHDADFLPRVAAADGGDAADDGAVAEDEPGLEVELVGVAPDVSAGAGEGPDAGEAVGAAHEDRVADVLILELVGGCGGDGEVVDGAGADGAGIMGGDVDSHEDGVVEKVDGLRRAELQPRGGSGGAPGVVAGDGVAVDDELGPDWRGGGGHGVAIRSRFAGVGLGVEG